MYSIRYSCQILLELQVPLQIFVKYQITDFMKICPVGGELFQPEGRTDMTKVTFAFRNFANAPKSC